MATMARKATTVAVKQAVPYDKGWLTDRKTRLDKLTHDPHAMAGIMARVADGEHLAAICREFNVAYQSMREFIDSTGPLRESYERAQGAAQDIRIERILRSIEDIGEVSVDEIYTEDGALKPLSEMSERAKKAISSIKTTELTDREGNVMGLSRDVKLYDKLKAKELLGKREKLFGDGQGGGGKGGVTVVVNRGCGQEAKDGVTIESGGQSLTVEG